MGQKAELLTTMVLPVGNCARCSGDHESISFQPFMLTPHEMRASHWAMCPTVNEPILLMVEDDEEHVGVIVTKHVAAKEKTDG